MKSKWLLVADLASLKAYKVENSAPTRKPHLELVDAFENSEAHNRLVDKVSDLAGRFPKGMGPNGSSAGAMSDGERHNIELENRKRLVKRLVERVSSLMRRDDLYSCCLAASREINNQLLEEIEPRLRAKIEVNIAADLTKIDKSELLRYFAERA